MTKLSAPPPIRKRRRFLPVLLLTGVVVAAAGSWLFHRRSQVLVHLPPAPGLQNRPAVLAQEIARANRDARSFLHSVRGLARLARLYEANGFYPEALRCYAALREREPSHARWWHLAAGIHANFGRIEEARPLWDKAIALSPEYLPSRIRLGDILLKSNQTAEASRVYEDALRVQPAEPYALLGLARIQAGRQDWPEARRLLQQALQAHPEFVGAMSLLVTVEEKLGNAVSARRLRAQIGQREFVDQVDPWTEELTDFCYDAYRLSVAAAVARHRGENTRARILLERAIELTPENGTYRRQIGQLLRALQDYPSARRELEKAARLAPTDSDAWLQLVEVLVAQQRPGEAEQTLLAALAQVPRSAALRLKRGELLAQQGRFDEAQAELLLSKQLQPSEAHAYIALAMVQFSLGRIDAGIAELEAALIVQPGNVLALQILTRHAINLQDVTAARRWLRLLAETERGSAEDLGLIRQEFRQAFGREP